MNAITMPTKPVASSGCTCGGSSKDPCTCSCGGATCETATMIRPRFFAGQLLTEDDLQSLEDYVLTKNRLHNRRLFGSGVVCGLDVFCNPCGGGKVVVQPGYALDCCGNDIVLDCKIDLDINAMIRDLRLGQLGGYDCGDPCAKQQQASTTGTVTQGTTTATASSSDGPVRDYCLYVRYYEQETDSVSPYAIDEPCTPQSCEPSRVREGLRFELRCRPKEKPPVDLLGAFESCFEDLVGTQKMTIDALTLLTATPASAAPDIQALKPSFDDLRSYLLDLIDRSSHPLNCTLRAKVLAVPPPDPSSIGRIGKTPAYIELVAIFLTIYKACFCAAINPPCPPCDDVGVLLACLKVKDCDVIEICSLERQFVASPAALRYWLSFERLGRSVEAFCCREPECRPASILSDQSVTGDLQPTPAPPPPPTQPTPDHAGPTETTVGRPQPPLTFAARSAEFLQGLLSVANAVDPQVRLDTIIANAREIARLLGLPDQTPTQPTGGPGTTAVDALLQDEVGKQVQAAAQRIEDGVTQQIQTAVQAAIGPLQQTIASLQDQLAARPAAKKRPSRGGGTGGPNG